MPAPVLHSGAIVLCAHAGKATPLAPNARVLVSAQPVVTLTSPYAIAGCGLAGTLLLPCVTGKILAGTTRVLVGGAPVATLLSQLICLPTGTPILLFAAQTRVLAS